MKNILSKILEHRGIKSEKDLAPDEKVQWDNWRKTLSKESLTMKDIEEFCETQIDLIENKWKDYEYEKKADLIPYHNVYKTLLAAINAPKVAREQLEKYLIGLIK